MTSGFGCCCLTRTQPLGLFTGRSVQGACMCVQQGGAAYAQHTMSTRRLPACARSCHCLPSPALQRQIGVGVVAAVRAAAVCMCSTCGDNMPQSHYTNPGVFLLSKLICVARLPPWSCSPACVVLSHWCLLARLLVAVTGRSCFRSCCCTPCVLCFRVCCVAVRWPPLAAHKGTKGSWGFRRGYTYRACSAGTRHLGSST